MTQITQLGEAELDTYARVDRANGSVEYYHIVGGKNILISEAEYLAATEE